MRRPRLLAAIVLAQTLGVLFADAGHCAAAYGLAVAAMVIGCGLRRPALLAIAAGLGAAAAVHAFTLARAESGRALARGEHTLDVRIAARREVASGTAVVLDLELDEADLPARAELFVSDAREPRGEEASPLRQAMRGERWRVRLRLHPLRAAINPGSPNRLLPRKRRGMAARATLVHPALAVRTGEGRATRFARPLLAVRERASADLAGRGAGGALVRALALGDRSGLGDAREAFAALGVSHLLAISGLHLGLVLGAAYGVAQAGLRALPAGSIVGDRRVAALAIALASASGYAALTGFAVPLQRALVFALAAALCLHARRPGAARSGFWAAASVLIALEPAALFDLGAQLSFAAAGALVYARRAPLEQELAPGWAPLRLAHAGLRVSATALAATAPLLAAHALAASPVALVANVLLVPWTAAVLLPGALLAALCAALHTGDLLVGLVVEVAAATLAAVATTASWLPPLATAVPPSIGRIGFALVLAFAALRARPTAARAALALALVLVLRLPPPGGDGDASVRAVALDVGSGDAVLLQARERAVLIDGGLALEGAVDLGRSRVLPALAALGIARLDVVVATHADADHVGGLPAVIDRVPVDAVWLPRGRADDPAFAPLLRAARERNVAVREISAASAATSLGPDLRLEPLWPPPAGASGASGASSGRNASSLVLLATLGESRLLLTGDLDRAGERALLASGRGLRADVLKLAHHGSATSTHAAWLDAVRPAVALLSAACDRQGLPAESVLERLRRRGIALWWTARDGAVFVRSSPLAVYALAPGEGC